MIHGTTIHSYLYAINPSYPENGVRWEAVIRVMDTEFEVHKSVLCQCSPFFRWVWYQGQVDEFVLILKWAEICSKAMMTLWYNWASLARNNNKWWPTGHLCWENKLETKKYTLLLEIIYVLMLSPSVERMVYCITTSQLPCCKPVTCSV